MSFQDNPSPRITTRLIDAPRESVFLAWTDAGQVKKWRIPSGFTLPFSKADFFPGGTFEYCLRSDKGDEYWFQGIYQEIDDTKKIVYTLGFSDADGKPVAASHYNLASSLSENTPITVTFSQEGTETTVTISSLDSLSEVEGSWDKSLDRLQAFLRQQ